MHRVAVVQAGSVYGDVEATLDRLERLVREAGHEGAELAVFPEAFLGGYPKGLTFGAPVGRRTEAGRRQYEGYAAGAIELHGPEMDRVHAAASATGVFLIVGLIERAGGTLFCTAAMVDPVDGLVGYHRKLMPTAAERLIWGFGDGSTIGVVDSPVGKVGTVICWENYMPMLRQAMYAQGVKSIARRQSTTATSGSTPCGTSRWRDGRLFSRRASMRSAVTTRTTTA